MSKRLKVSATGDSLFVADIPSEYNPIRKRFHHL